MKGSCLSVNKIYGEASVHSLKTRINFISSKRKKKWLSIEPNLQLTQPHRLSSTDSHHSPIDLNRQPAVATQGRPFWHSKVKSMELQDLKTRRYQHCKQESERIMQELEARRAVDLHGKQIRRLKVVREQQSGREALRAQEELRLQESRHLRDGVEAALQVRTIEMQQQLQREEDLELQRYEEELSYRSLVMRRIQQLIEQDRQMG